MSRLGSGRDDAARSQLEHALRPRHRVTARVTQLVYVLAGVALGVLAPRLPGPAVSTTDIRAMLFAIGGGIVALISVIFSLLFLVVQWGSSSFSPRLALFRDDPTVWHGFGYFLGMFAYCTIAGLVVGDDTTVTVLVPILAFLMVVASLILIRRLQLRAFRSIQLSSVLTDVDLRGRAVLDSIDPMPFESGTATRDLDPSDEVGRGDAGRSVRWRSRPMVLQQVHLARLIDVAAAANAVIVVRVAVGDTVQEGAVLATVAGDDGGRVDDAAVLDAVVTGIERTFDQDPRLAFRLVVDIALRASSAAINDQATTVQCLDVLEGLLRHLAQRRLDIGHVTGPDGRLRVVLTVPRWPDYISETLDDLVLTGDQSPMVLARIRRLLIDLLPVVPERRRPPLTSRLQLVEQALQQRFPLAWQHVLEHDPGAR